MASSAAKKKPRTRKLEKDRARGGDVAKKGSSRHAAAKKVASDKRKKATAKKKPAKATTRYRNQDDLETTSSRASKPKSAADRSRPAAKRSAAKPARASRDDRHERDDRRKPAARKTSRSAYGERDRYERDDRRKPAEKRTSRYSEERAPRRDDRKPAEKRTSRYSDERPARSDDRRPAEKRTSRYSDERPARREPKKSDIKVVREKATETRRPRTEEKTAPAKVKAPRVSVTDPEVTNSEWVKVGVLPEIAAVLKNHGIDKPFAIQEKTLPSSIAGRDILGRAATGSGKTLAFGLAMLTKLGHREAKPYHPMGLVLTPTRELAAQVTDALMPFAQSVDLDIRLIAGGMPYSKQIDALRRAVPILVATPGRLNDLIEQGHVNLDDLEIIILDEADQMCDMGFMPQIVEVLDLCPKGIQHLLFSATLDGDVDKIVKKYLNNPETHATATAKASVSTMEHHLLVVMREDKSDVISQIASRDGKTIMFVKTQAGVDRIAKELAHAGVPTGALHGGKSQAVRTRTLKNFKDGLTDVLVATDVAARGIHVDGISLVVHVDPPGDPKDYLHRAGRTARAGEEGAVVTLITPRQQKSVTGMMSRAGVNPKVTKVKPMSKDLVAITGAAKPSGIPWKEPDAPKRSGGRSGGGRSGAGRSRSGGAYRGKRS